MVRKLFRILSLSAALIALQLGAGAAPLITKVGGDLTVTGLFDGTSFTLFDVRGLVLLGVEDPSIPLALTAVLYGDASGGTDTTGAVVPFGNQFLLAIDGTPGLAVLSFFDFAHLSFNGPTLTIPVYFAPYIGTPAVNGALDVLTKSGAIPFDFQFTQTVDFGQGLSLTQWTLPAAVSAVPEGATLPLMATGLGIFAALLRRRRIESFHV